MTTRSYEEPDVRVSPLDETELEAADRVFRLAFGTLFGLAEPIRHAEGADLVHGRWRADPTAAFKAEVDGELVGSAFLARWGSVAIFGPLTVHPDYWDKGVGRRLWEESMPALVDEWGATHTGLFTHPESPKHVHLYQTFGFWPRFLIAITAKQVGTSGRAPAEWLPFSGLSADERERCLGACRELTDEIYPGLDLEREIRAVAEQAIGEVVLLGDADRPDGFAVCHLGEGSEAGPGTTHVKFAAARSGAGAAGRFQRLLDACEALADARGLPRLVAGVNVARRDAYRILLARGHRTFIQGVAMHRPDEPGYAREDVFVIDEWR